MIGSQNTLLNQYSPTYYIRNIHDGQTLVYDATKKAFVNADVDGTSGGADRLGQLLDVNSSVDNPMSLHNGQALTYNSFSGLWENSYTDYNTLLNKPTSSSFSFAGLSDTAKPSLPDGYVKWNSAGTQLVYSTSIPAASITGLATVATTGNYNDLLNKPVTVGTVTSVTALGTQGVTTFVTNSTSTPNITVGLGAITPSSVSATGTVLGSNLSGTNTGDQTITLTGDATGTGTGIIALTLSTTVNLTPGVYGTAHLVPTITVNNKGLVTSITTQHVDTSVRDLVDVAETLIIAPRHQYIVTSRLEVLGRIENNGRIAIL